MVTCKVETITPQIAAKMLESNTANFRALNLARVSQYAAEMRSGNWHLNGGSISFNGSVLLDGQHRLEAVVKSGATIQSVVVRGIEADASHIDRGMTRTISQWLTHEGIPNATQIAAVARLCVIHDKGHWDKMGMGVDLATDSEILAFARKHHQDISQYIARATLPKGLFGSYVAAVLFLGSRGNSGSMARWFLEALCSGADVSETDAVLHLRNRFVQQGVAKVTPYMARMLLTLAWNKTVEDIPCAPSSIRLRLTGENASKPPKFVLAAQD